MSADRPSHQSPRKVFKVTAGSHALALGVRTQIMGIMNLTPDSFSGDGCYTGSAKDCPRALRLARKLIQEGADILDVGGESTRPGSRRVSVKEEIQRVVPVIRVLSKKIKVPISVDTYKSGVAKHALDAGASIVNNIMGTKENKGLLRMVRNYNAAVCLMHIQGTPKNMQQGVISYNKITLDIKKLLKKSIEKCLEIGIKSDRIIIDPGIGFGKTVGHNLEILNHLRDFQGLNKPILVGTSRKSFIGKMLYKEVHQRIHGSLATACAALLNGAHILRVHDVKETKEAATVIDAIMNVDLPSMGH